MERFLRNPAYLFAGAAALIAGAVGLAIMEQNQWEAFAKEHQCKVVGKIAGHTAYGYYNGKYQSYWVSGKTVYRCNDGIDYTR